MAPRKRIKDKDLPPRVYRHGESYRFIPVDPATGRNAKPINLGRDKAVAMRKWAQLVGEPPPANSESIKALWERYVRQELPKKATATQSSYRQHAKRIIAVFGRMRPGDILPSHAVDYLDRRGEQSPTQANREISLLRTMLSKAAHWGMIDRNPLLGLQYRNPEKPRNRYVTDEELEQAMGMASPWIKALMWIAYLTGLRRGDVLRLTRFQIRKDGLEVMEKKTGKRVLIEWTTELKTVVQEALDASPDDRLFPLTPKSADNAWTRFQDKYVGAGGTRFQVKDLRAKHATDLEQHGGDATTQLGHSNRGTTTRHYLRAPRRVVPIR